MSKISAYTELAAVAAGDMLPIVDVSDTAMALSGTTKKVAVATLIAVPPPAAMGLTSQYVEWSVAQNVFPAMPGVIYLASASGGNITMQLPPAGSVPPGSNLVIKRVDSAGYTVTAAPFPGEYVNGLPGGFVNPSQGLGRWFWPLAPDGPAAGPGWMSY